LLLTRASGEILVPWVMLTHPARADSANSDRGCTPPHNRRRRALVRVVDNAVILAVPGAMEAGLSEPLFWGALALGLGIAWIAAFPVNRWLLARGMGHAKAMAHHGHD
jgi:hypothetical protein